MTNRMNQIQKRIMADQRQHLRDLRAQNAVSLSHIEMPRHPGVYAIFLNPSFKFPIYQEAISNNAAVYFGSAKNLAKRMNDYRNRLSNRVASMPLDALLVAGLSMHCRFEAEAVESRFIESDKPVWNQTWMSGFGSKVQGKNRQKQKKQPWDELHPGRKGTAKGLPKHARHELADMVGDHLKECAPGAQLRWR